MLYLLTFFLFGFPDLYVGIQFDVAVVPVDSLLYALLASTSFYAIYYVTYKVRLRKSVDGPSRSLFTMNRVETNLTWILLALIAFVTVKFSFCKMAFFFKLKRIAKFFFKPSVRCCRRFFYSLSQQCWWFIS